MKRRIISALVVATAILVPVSVLAVLMGAWLQYVGNPVIPLGKKGTWDDKSVNSARVVYDGAGYRMWYAASGSNNSRAKIGYAISADGLTWKKPFTEPVLEPSAGLKWDSEGVTAPTVLYDANTRLWKMWYAGLSLYGGGYQIGYATSVDGISWSKYIGNPVLVPGPSTWDSDNVLSPNVLYRNGIYHMWYAGKGDRLQIGYATSTDGITWTKNGSNPVLPFGGDLDWDNGEIASPSVLWMSNHYEMWYQGYNRIVQRTFIGHAQSPDGIAWTKYDINPVMGGQPLTWDAFSVYYPSVVQAGTQLMMWFHGEPSALAQKQIGVALWDKDAIPTVIPSIVPPPATDTPTPTPTPTGATPTLTPTITGTPPTLTPTPTTQGQGDNCIGDVPECIFMPQMGNNPAQ